MTSLSLPKPNYVSPRIQISRKEDSKSSKSQEDGNNGDSVEKDELTNNLKQSDKSVAKTPMSNDSTKVSHRPIVIKPKTKAQPTKVYRRKPPILLNQAKNR